MSENNSTTDGPETLIPETPASGAQALKNRVAAFLHKHRVRLRRAAKWGGIVLTLSFAAYATFFRAPAEDEVTVAPGPTDAERFQLQFDELVKSKDPVARLQALMITDEMLAKLCSLEGLTTIQVYAKSISTETIRKLAAMPSLEQLHLRGAEITDEMVAELAKSKTIWLLNLPNAKLSPEGIEQLASMPLLRQLRLGIADGDNRHGRAVSTLERLRAVHLIGIAVTDEGLRALARMRNLESLYLDDSAVTETGWLWLFQENPQLHVHVDQLHHDNDPNKH